MDRLHERILNDIRSELVTGRLVLPSLPNIVLEIWTALERPSATGRQLERVIRKDPGLSVRLLAIANSAYYRGVAPVSDLKRAIVRLGQNVVKHMVGLLGIAQLYNAKDHPKARPYLVSLWNQSTLVASLSEILSRDWPHLQPEVAMLAGLIHRVGVLPVVTRAEKTPALISDPRIMESLIEALHPEVGRMMLEKWRFPEELLTVVRSYADLTRDSEGLADYTDIVQVAFLVSNWDADHTLDEEAWRRIPSVQSVDLDIADVSDLLGYAGTKVGELRSLLGPR